MLFSQLVLNWYHQNGRKSLPWKKDKNPYKVWISEIMLQQTQVKTVIPYYKKFIKKFPNVNILAHTTINHILNAWSGLGYYNRAHNIYRTANIIVKNYQGKFPDNLIDIIKLPGIGRTTAGAILSFGFNLYACILECNIKRLLLRYFNLHNYNTKHIDKKLWSIINLLTPIHKTSQFNQAIMDIGALICLKSLPKCYICPINKTCLFFIQKQKIEKFIYTPKKQKKTENIFLLIIQYKNLMFLCKSSINKIWKGLYCFPTFYNQLEILKWIKENNIKIKSQKMFEKFIYKISHIHFFCTPIKIKITNSYFINEIKQSMWLNVLKPQCVGLSTLTKKVIKICLIT
ncbi:MAG: A/G-specific adenine glycosylase [Buchnera aphidicola (Nurudea shiraii)]